MSTSDEYEKIHLGDDILVEVNWATSVTPCKAFKITIGDKSSIVPRDAMFGLLFLFADEKEQEDLIPVIETKVRSISRLLTFTLKKDMRKGEKLRARYQYFVPETVYEKLLLTDPEKYKSADLSTNVLEGHVNKIV